MEMNRKGDWIQAFMIIFFVLVVMITFLLVALQRATSNPVDEKTLKQNILDQQAKIVLISWLRTPVNNVNIKGTAHDLDMATYISTLGFDELYGRIGTRFNDEKMTNSIPGFYVLNIRHDFEESDYTNFLAGDANLEHADMEVIGKDETKLYVWGYALQKVDRFKRDIGENTCQTYMGILEEKGNVFTVSTGFFRELGGPYGKAAVIIPGKDGNLLVQLEYTDKLQDKDAVVNSFNTAIDGIRKSKDGGSFCYG